jgi:hypothetical protein
MYDPESLPDDQRAAEPYGLVYSTAPLQRSVELLGQANLRLTLSASQPVAQLFARLCDVAPDGRSTLVSWGALNLTHRDSHSSPTPLIPGQSYLVEVEFGAVSWRFQPGHVVRLVMNNHDWPRLWPAPTRFDLEIYHGPGKGGCLCLPSAPPPRQTIAPPPLPPARLAGRGLTATTDPWRWQIVQERPSNCLRFSLGRQEGVELDDQSLVETTFRRLEVSVSEDNPADNAMTAFADAFMAWPEGEARVTADLRISGTLSTFEFDLTVEVFSGNEPIAVKRWQESIPRRLV